MNYQGKCDKARKQTLAMHSWLDDEFPKNKRNNKKKKREWYERSVWRLELQAQITESF